MKWFTGPNEDVAPIESEGGYGDFIDLVTDPGQLVARNPLYAERFDAIKELRDQDDGSTHRGQEFRRVASLVNVPMLEVVKLLEPNFLKDKKNFYQWLDRGDNRAYCTYQRRRGSRPIANAVTFVDGKEV